MSAAADAIPMDPADPPAQAPPPGIIPLFLSSATQALFRISDEEAPLKENSIFPQTLAFDAYYLPKEDILQDIFTRAAVSDFQPFKTTITVCYAAELGMTMARNSLRTSCSLYGIRSSYMGRTSLSL